MTAPVLLAVPNFSEGRDERVIAAIGQALAGGERQHAVEVLDVHSDADHNRCVFTLAGGAIELADALLRSAAVAVAQIDVMKGGLTKGSWRGKHPYVGALDVAPLVYLDAASRGAACAGALLAADRIGEELRVPVFLYGELTADAGRTARSRAQLRRGGPAGLAERMAALDRSETGQHPDFGPPRLHPTAGATLVAAREPLVAFNLQLAAPATVDRARAIAALVREGGEEGLPGVRAIGVALSGGVAQVSMNIERPLEMPMAAVIEAVGRHVGVDSAELVGLAPRAALEGFPADVPLHGFDPGRHVIENALGF